MKQRYVIRGYMAHSEKDNYENGCTGECKNEFVYPSDWSIKADDLQELIDSLSFEFRANDENSFIFNSCNEMGRLDLQVNQRQAFSCNKLRSETIDLWKAGEIDLWLTTYTFQVEIVQTEIDLQALRIEKCKQ